MALIVYPGPVGCQRSRGLWEGAVRHQRYMNSQASAIKVRIVPHTPHLGLRCSPVLVGTTHVDGVVAAGAAEACVAVGAEHAADDVSEVGHVVHVGEGAGDLHRAGRQQGGCTVAVMSGDKRNGQAEISLCNPSLQPTKILRWPGKGSLGCAATYAFASARYSAETAALLSLPRTCASACFTAGRAASVSMYCQRGAGSCCLMGRRVQYTTTCRQGTSNRTRQLISWCHWMHKLVNACAAAAAPSHQSVSCCMSGAAWPRQHVCSGVRAQ